MTAKPEAVFCACLPLRPIDRICQLNSQDDLGRHHAALQAALADAHPFTPGAAEVSDKASPTKGVRYYDALKAKRWHPDFGLQGVTVAEVRSTLVAARQSPLWAPGGKKAPSSAAIASAYLSL